MRSRHCEPSDVFAVLKSEGGSNPVLENDRDCIAPSLTRLAMTPSTTPDWRQDHLIAAAGAAVDLITGAKLQILAEADAYFAQPLPVASHRDRRGRQARIRLDEGVLDVGRRNRFRLGQLQEFLRDLDRGPRFANGFEIGALTEAGAGAVLVPFIVDQPRRRHQVEHRGHDVSRKARRRMLAIFGKAMLVLRP